MAIIAGIIAASLGGSVAVLVSLPLRSPDDLFLNSASVALLSLFSGFVVGPLWWFMKRRGYSVIVFEAVWFVLFWAIGISLMVVAITQLNRVVEFLLPILIIGSISTSFLTPIIGIKVADKLQDKSGRLKMVYYGVACLIVGELLILGWLLRNMGDFVTRMLELPVP